MQEINLLQYQKKLQRERLYKVLKNNRNTRLALIASSIQSSGLLLSDNEFLRAILIMLIASELRYLRQEIKKEEFTEAQEITKILRESSTYKECTIEYERYIKEVAILIKQLGFTTSKEIVAYLQILLENGYFSKNLNHKYKKFPYENEYITELCGARVLTGKSVCRHTSSFFADILNELGYTAACIQVISSKKDPTKLITNKSIKSNHAIIGVIENGMKYMYDTTIGLYVTPASEINVKTPDIELISEYVTKETKKQYIIIDPKSRILNPHRRLQIGRLNKVKEMTITNEEVEILKNKAETIFQENKNNQYDFFSKQEYIRTQVETLYKELCPFGDNKIKSWRIRK